MARKIKEKHKGHKKFLVSFFILHKKMQFSCFPQDGQEEKILKRKVKHEEIMSRLSDIAFGKANDIVKLAFLNPEENLALLDELDLTMLSEVKRTTGGAVEVKLVNRLEAMELHLSE